MTLPVYIRNLNNCHWISKILIRFSKILIEFNRFQLDLNQISRFSIEFQLNPSPTNDCVCDLQIAPELPSSRTKRQQWIRTLRRLGNAGLQWRQLLLHLPTVPVARNPVLNLKNKSKFIMPLSLSCFFFCLFFSNKILATSFWGSWSS